MAGKKGLRNAAHTESGYEPRIQVPVTNEQKARYVNYAQANGLKLAALIRKLLDDQIKTDRKLK